MSEGSGSALRVLACAYAANPRMGSESYVGWAGLLALSRRHRITAIVHGHNREDIEAVLPSLPQRENLRFVYIGERHRWHPNRLIARFQDWYWLAQWNAAAHQAAMKLASSERFDVAHHLTIATWRLPSPLGGLGLPLVWGPVGGGEHFPFSFYRILSRVSQAFELMRWAGNLRTVRSAKMRRFAQSVSVGLGNNPETQAALRGLGIPADRVRYLSQSFLGPEKFVSGENGGGRTEMRHSPLRIFAGGNLEGRKGIAIALRALSSVGRSGVPFEFTYGGLGPEFAHIQRLASSLDFGAGTVSLGNHFTGEEYRNRLRDADVYLLPSLREGAPVTMIEAMAARTVPIVAAAGGAPMVVDETCGIVVPVTDPRTMAETIAARLCELAADRSKIDSLGTAAWKRARERCMEDTYLRGIEDAYAAALAGGANAC